MAAHLLQTVSNSAFMLSVQSRRCAALSGAPLCAAARAALAVFQHFLQVDGALVCLVDAASLEETDCIACSVGNLGGTGLDREPLAFSGQFGGRLLALGRSGCRVRR